MVISIQDPLLRELGRAVVNVLTHGLMVQALFLMIFRVLLIIGVGQAAPDSALMKWEVARKSKVGYVHSYVSAIGTVFSIL